MVPASNFPEGAYFCYRHYPLLSRMGKLAALAEIRGEHEKYRKRKSDIVRMQQANLRRRLTPRNISAKRSDHGDMF
jgi:hypothetical protein